jgi:hypothetical protein
MSQKREINENSLNINAIKEFISEDEYPFINNPHITKIFIVDLQKVISISSRQNFTNCLLFEYGDHTDYNSYPDHHDYDDSYHDHTDHSDRYYDHDDYN